MKIRITYDENEKEKALFALAFFRRLLPGARVKRDDKNSPYMHLYLADANGKHKREQELDAHR